jgi:hypothetical protein
MNIDYIHHEFLLTKLYFLRIREQWQVGSAEASCSTRVRNVFSINGRHLLGRFHCISNEETCFTLYWCSVLFHANTELFSPCRPDNAEVTIQIYLKTDWKCVIFNTCVRNIPSITHCLFLGRLRLKDYGRKMLFTVSVVCNFSMDMVNTTQHMCDIEGNLLHECIW